MKWYWIVIVSVILIAVIAILAFPASEEVYTEDGITYYPDGSYSYQVEYAGGQIIEYTISANGETTAELIQQGTVENLPGVLGDDKK